MRFPVDNFRITSYQTGNHKEGVDIAPNIPGTLNVRINAPEQGQIKVVGKGAVEGNYLFLKGKETGKWYYFGHFASIVVKEGQSVKEGQKLGSMGKTGQATGIHTHHEIRQTRTTGRIDVLKWYLRKGVYKGKSAEQWYDRAVELGDSRNAWRSKSIAQQETIKQLQEQLSQCEVDKLELKKQLDECREGTKSILQSIVDFINSLIGKD